MFEFSNEEKKHRGNSLQVLNEHKQSKIYTTRTNTLKYYIRKHYDVI